MKKKILSLFLCVAMLCAMLPMMAVSASAEAPEGWDYATADTTATADWYDAEATTLEINSAADLLAFAAKIQATARADASVGPFNGKTVKLMKNIDLNPGWDASTKSATGANIVWPVHNQRMFNGMFDGNGKTIRGVYMTSTDFDTGMFGMVGGGTEANPSGVKDLTLENFYGINTKNGGNGALRFGALFGSANAEHIGSGYVLVENVHLTDSVYLVHSAATPNAEVGGYFGKIMWQGNSNHMTVEIKNSSFDGDITSAAGKVGAFVGYACGFDKLIMDGCTFGGTICATEKIGGLIGEASQFNASFKVAVDIKNCVSKGTIDISNAASVVRWCKVGGFIGNIDTGSTIKIDDSAFVGTLYSKNGTSMFGGFCGYIKASSVTVNNSLAAGKVQHAQNRGASFAGDIESDSTVTLQNVVLFSEVRPGGYTWQWSGALAGFCASKNVTLKNVLYSDTYSNYVTAGYILTDPESIQTLYGGNYTAYGDTLSDFYGADAYENYFKHHLIPWGNYYSEPSASVPAPTGATSAAANKYLPAKAETGYPLVTYPSLTNVKYVSYDNRFDMDPAGALVAAMGEAGLTSANGWTLTTTNGPIPTAVLDKIDLVNTPANAKTQFKGFQGSQIADGKYNVRLIGLVDGLDPKEVGFRVIVRYNDGIEANVTTTSSVYTSVIGGARTYTVAELGGDADDYIFALNVNGIQESKGVVTVEVTTFHVKDDVTTIGQTQVFTVDPANDLPKAGV